MESLKRYAQHIDDIRIQKGLTVKELCLDICNERSYRRYLSGERKLPQNKVIAFCHRLDISPTDFYQTFLEKDKIEFQKVYKLYYLLLNGKKDEYAQEVTKVDPKYLINSMNIKLYKYVVNWYSYMMKKITLKQAYSELSTIVNFPNCVSSNIFDFADIIIIDTLVGMEKDLNIKEMKALQLLHRILLDDKVRYITSDGKRILPSIYATVALNYLDNGKYDECIELASEGINNAIRYGTSFALTNLYYAKAIALHNIDKTEDAYIEAANCLGNTMSIQNTHHFSIYSKLFKSKIGLTSKVILDKYVDKYISK